MLAPLLTAPTRAQTVPPSPSPATDGRAPALARASITVKGTVVDPRGRPVSGAAVSLRPDGENAVTDGLGRFSLSISAPATARTRSVYVEASSFAPSSLPIALHGSATRPLRVVLALAADQQSVLVTAYRTPLAADESPASTRTLTRARLRASAGTTLDDKLRQVPGFELFRRSSSLVANPTSQGLSLRGLGSTAASRTLVVSDEVPLNDPFGGWIYWDELPELAIQSVGIVRGGASDLYGSSAIGGVVEITPLLPVKTALQVRSSFGSFHTFDDAFLGSAAEGHWAALAAGTLLRTNGYTLVAPQFRGPVDIPSNLDALNGRIEADRAVSNSGRLFARGNVLSEARSNGTPLNTNGTRLWRAEAGADLNTTSGGAFLLRLYGSSEHFRQTFSTVAAGRATEALTRLVQTPTTALGAAARWTQSLSSTLLLLAGADTHDIRGGDNEQSFTIGASSVPSDLSARQRQTGVYAEALWTPPHWTISASGRVDHFSNFDARQLVPAVAAYPSLSETVFDPRLGVVRRLNSAFALTATGFRAYRAPTENELYRTGQVGQETTLPNHALQSERATGWETGFILESRHPASILRGSYFWTEVNRPITALTLTVTPTSILNQRANLGQIESRGISLDGETHPRTWLTATGGYQYALATVTKFAPEPDLVGKWIPQVARNTATLQLRAVSASLGVVSIEGRISGRQYDDDNNAFLLHGFFALNVYASHTLRHRVEIFAAGENLLDRSIEVGRTPVLTLGTPRAVRAGLQFNLAHGP